MNFPFRCVKCKKSAFLSDGVLEDSSTIIYRPVRCTNCGAKYVEHYKLDAVYILDKEDNEVEDVIQAYFKWKKYE
jgi:DNA-directed RNA polymerase subunit RPC12/RpoP